MIGVTEMKKLCSFLLVLCFLFSLSACGGNETTVDNGRDGFCTECGEDISATDKFCGSCGTPIVKTTTDNSTTNATQNNDSGDLDSTDIPSSPTNTSTTKPTATTKPSTPSHTHSYSNATCTAPAKCSCGATNGSALGHSYSNATCTSPKKCSRCNSTSGSALGHNYSNGVCSRCNSKDPNYVKTYSLGEKWIVNGQWEFTINKAEKHHLCNDYSNKEYGFSTEQVVIIDYTFKNIDYDYTFGDLWMGGFTVYDETGMSSTSYACTHTKYYPQECIKGASSRGQEQHVIFNDSKYITIVIEHIRDDDGPIEKAVFKVPMS